jgi:hypothetical protein
VIYISKKELDGPADAATCRGFEFTLTSGGVGFRVRNYVDKPGEFTVVSLEADRASHEVRQLVDYLASMLGGRRMFFYDGRVEAYREVDLRTLDFKPAEDAPVQKCLELNAEADDQTAFGRLRFSPA